MQFPANSKRLPPESNGTVVHFNDVLKTEVGFKHRVSENTVQYSENVHHFDIFPDFIHETKYRVTFHGENIWRLCRNTKAETVTV